MSTSGGLYFVYLTLFLSLLGAPHTSPNCERKTKHLVLPSNSSAQFLLARARGYRTTRLRSSALSEVPSWRNGQTNRQTDASRRSQVRRLICRAGITCRLMIDQIRPSVDPWRPRPSSGLRHARSKQNCQPGVVWRTAASCATSATRCRTTDRLSKHEVYAKECRQRSVIEPIKPCIVSTTVITPTTACTTQASGMSVLIFPPHA
ncbi:hypothetical protein HDV57DRAFT_196119 [Trichoderma longibrachiatum]